MRLMLGGSGLDLNLCLSPSLPPLLCAECRSMVGRVAVCQKVGGDKPPAPP